MARKRGSELARRVYTLGADRHDDAVAAIDVELQEVRDVLRGLVVSFPYGECCWCALPPNAGSVDHTLDCERARALYEKLEVK
jgi:hypothetical protein